VVPPGGKSVFMPTTNTSIFLQSDDIKGLDLLYALNDYLTIENIFSVKIAILNFMYKIVSEILKIMKKKAFLP
jgi:hypothetical protein